MTVIKLLHLSDVHYLCDVSPMRLMALLHEKKRHQPDLLLVAGISKTGTEDELVAARVALEQLIQLLKLRPDQILIAPNRMDLNFGYGTFSTLIHEPLLGHRYDPLGPGLLHCPPHLQFFSLNTIPLKCTLGVSSEAFKTYLTTAKQQTEQPLPPSFLRAMFFYHPVPMWKDPPTGPVKKACLNDHLRLAFFGQTHAKITSRFLYSIGVEAGVFHYFQYFTTKQKIFSTFGHLVGNGWQLGDSLETAREEVQPTEQKTARCGLATGAFELVRHR